MANTMLDVVEDLRGYDHAFISKEGVEHFSKAFGVKLTAFRHRADAGPKNPKGLTLNGGAKSAVGMDAATLASIVCDSLGVDYAEKFGRGSQLGACCTALEEHFKK
jgi:hypothetical protein